MRMVRSGGRRRAKLGGHQKNFMRLFVERHRSCAHLRGNILDDAEFIRRISCTTVNTPKSRKRRRTKCRDQSGRHQRPLLSPVLQSLFRNPCRSRPSFVAATGKQAVVFRVDRKAGGFGAWRERPVRQDGQVLRIELHFLALVFHVDEDMALAVSRSEFELSADRNRAGDICRWRHQLP